MFIINVYWYRKRLKGELTSRISNYIDLCYFITVNKILRDSLVQKRPKFCIIYFKKHSRIQSKEEEFLSLLPQLGEEVMIQEAPSPSWASFPSIPTVWSEWQALDHSQGEAARSETPTVSWDPQNKLKWARIGGSLQFLAEAEINLLWRKVSQLCWWDSQS